MLFLLMAGLVMEFHMGLYMDQSFFFLVMTPSKLFNGMDLKCCISSFDKEIHVQHNPELFLLNYKDLQSLAVSHLEKHHIIPIDFSTLGYFILQKKQEMCSPSQCCKEEKWWWQTCFLSAHKRTLRDGQKLRVGVVNAERQFKKNSRWDARMKIYTHKDTR